MRIRGIGAAPGYATGPIWRYFSAAMSEPLEGEAPSQNLSISEAAAIAAGELVSLADRVRETGRDSEAGILEAQALMATDDMIVAEAERMAGEGASGPAELARVVQMAGQAAAAALAWLDDELLAARAADVRDVAGRIARILSGQRITPPAVPSIAVADDLPPSVTLELPEGSLIGIVLQEGSRTSHAAILSRALGIPAVVATPGLLSAVAQLSTDEGLVIAVDGAKGDVFLSPTDEEQAELRRRERVAKVEAEAARTLRGQPGQTGSGKRVPLVANIGSPGESARALDAGAEGVGLYRTEFVFMGRQDRPSELEQIAAYRDVLRDFGLRRTRSWGSAASGWRTATAETSTRRRSGRSTGRAPRPA
jgi:phosphoenolpyruvate-protein phosphotransferase (PTS system enzyme I)